MTWHLLAGRKQGFNAEVLTAVGLYLGWGLLQGDIIYSFIKYLLWDLCSSSVAQSYPTLCDPMNRSMPGLPVHHQLLESTQNHVHIFGDAIQSSHPLSSPSPPAPNPYRVRVFSYESALHIRWPKYWSFSFNISPSNEHLGLISFRMD